jgi:hypothetical protein
MLSVSFAIVVVLDALLLNSRCLKRAPSRGETQGQQVANLAKARAKESESFCLKGAHNSSRDRCERKEYFTLEIPMMSKPGLCRL